MLVSIVPKFQKSPTLVWCPGFLKPLLQHCLEFLYAPSKTGSKAVANHPGRQKPFSRSLSAILKFCKNSLREVVRPSGGFKGSDPLNPLVLELLRWETHAYPSMGRPQSVINAQIGDYDVFVGILWKRFGTPTGRAESGTEEEFRLAFDSWKKTKRPHILLYFYTAPLVPPKSAEEVRQLGLVIDFRERKKQRGRESFLRRSGALRLPGPLFLAQPAASETQALDGTFGIRAIASALDYLRYNSYPITRWSILSSTL